MSMQQRGEYSFVTSSGTGWYSVVSVCTTVRCKQMYAPDIRRARSSTLFVLLHPRTARLILHHLSPCWSLQLFWSAVSTIERGEGREGEREGGKGGREREGKRESQTFLYITGFPVGMWLA